MDLLAVDNNSRLPSAVRPTVPTEVTRLKLKLEIFTPVIHPAERLVSSSRAIFILSRICTGGNIGLKSSQTLPD
eukprot:482801-Hanusia_phi.AAC.4